MGKGVILPNQVENGFSEDKTFVMGLEGGKRVNMVKKRKHIWV